MNRGFARAVLLPAVLLLAACAGSPRLAEGPWQAWLESPGGPLPFEVEFRGSGPVLEAVVINGEERIVVPRATLHGETVELSFPHYDSSIIASIADAGRRLKGEWIRRSGPDTFSRLPFFAEAGSGPRFAPDASPVAAPPPEIGGRWSVDFESDDAPAVAELDQEPDGRVAGTILTTVGDYRYLAGRVDGPRLRLSTFDGAHAFLFDARLEDGGTLAGDFWSRDTWHETWTARRDPDASLPDPYSLTDWVDGTDLGSIELLESGGESRSLDDARLWGRATVIELFGTWCPNCNDAAAWLADLDARFRDRGLSIVGLAFELTGDPERDLQQVGVFAARHGIDFPLLLAGLSDKAQASAAFPAVDRVRAYPTIVIFDRERRVRAVHTGFSGPATGEAYQRQSERIETLIEQILDEEAD